GTDVHAGRADVLGTALRLSADENGPAALGGPALRPVDPIAVEPRLAEADDCLDELLDRDRRRPRSEGRLRRRVGGAVSLDGGLGTRGHARCRAPMRLR